MKNSEKIILDLCGGTGSWSKPYKDAGYDVRLITLPEKDVTTYKPPKNVYGIKLDNCDYVTMSLPRNQKFYVEKYRLWNKLFSYSHHKCHALGSYFTSGMNGKVMAISLDGRGNRSRGKVYLCDNGKYEQVHSHPISTSSSLAGLWGIVTTSLGWTTFKDEGKVVGLAGHGKFNQKIYDYLKKCFHYTNLRPLWAEENLKKGAKFII